jgi:dihydrofolate reductase
MRQLKILEHISLDGIIQAPGGPEEGYEYGGWWWPFHDPVLEAAMDAQLGQSFDLLLGRRTYDAWAGFWPTADSVPGAEKFNGATKYVATHRPESLTWAPVEDLGLDIAEGIGRVKAKDGPDILCCGSSSLTSLLLEHGLADEVHLIVAPVLLGKGRRLFSETTPPRELALVTTVSAPSGGVLNTYRPVGPLRSAPMPETAE